MSLDLANVTAGKRLNTWREFNAGIFDVKVEAEHLLQVKADAYRVGDRVIGRISNSGHVFRRNNPGRSGSRPDLLVVRVYTKGLTSGTFGGKNIEMSASEVAIYDYSQDVFGKTENADHVFFIVPHAAVGYDASRHPSFFNIPSSSPSGIIVRQNLKMLLELVPHSSVSDANLLAHGFCGLLQAFITDDLRDESVQQRFAASREVAVRRFLKQNLKNPDLNAELICASVGVSRAVLYRMFEEDGGVRKSIQKQRLIGAMDELCHTEPSRGSIGRIAKNWTFADQAHFSRLFRQTHGQKPTDVLGSSLLRVRAHENGTGPAGLDNDAGPTQMIGIYRKLDTGLRATVQ